MRRLVPVIAVVVVALAAGCSGGTEEVTRDASNRSTTTTRDETAAPEMIDPASPEASSEDTAADEPSEAQGTDGADGASGSTSAGPGRSGRSGTGSTGSAGDAGSPEATTPGAGASPGTDDATTEPGTAPFRPDPDRYDTYVGLARQYGGDVAGREDATALASVLCGDPAGARAEFLGGEPLGTYPSDLAIVRAYCPDKEPLF